MPEHPRRRRTLPAEPDGAFPNSNPPHIDLLTPWTDPKRPHQKPMTHLAWAENLARLIARTPLCGFSPQSAEADDLVGVAAVCLVELAARFDFAAVPAGVDPNDQFRGFAWIHLRKLCLREAERLKNGGTYNTTRDKEARRVRVGELSDRCPNCRDYLRAFEGDEDVTEDVEPIESLYEPVLSIRRSAPQ